MASISQTTAGELTQRLYPGKRKPKKFKSSLGAALAKGKTNGSSKKCA